MELSEEEKEAVETLESWKNYNIKNKNKLLKADEIIEIQETILTLISKLQKENELKDKVIDEMTKYIDSLTYRDKISDYGCDFELITSEPKDCRSECKDCIKQYFINKVKGE